MGGDVRRSVVAELTATEPGCPSLICLRSQVQIGARRARGIVARCSAATARPAPDASPPVRGPAMLKTFAQANIATGSTVVTDGLRSYPAALEGKTNVPFNVAGRRTATSCDLVRAEMRGGGLEEISRVALRTKVIVDMNPAARPDSFCPSESRRTPCGLRATVDKDDLAGHEGVLLARQVTQQARWCGRRAGRSVVGRR